MRSADKNSGGRYQIELVDKLVRLLEVLREKPGGMTLQQLAARTGFVKSSIHRALQSLKHHGYIEQSATGTYALGVQFLLLARAVQEGTSLIAFARPHMRELADTFDESAYLAILRGGQGIFVEVAETRRRELRLVGPLGATVHFHATAAGKVMAAFLPAGAQAALLKSIPLHRVTPRTRIRRAEIGREWAAVRRRGYAINDEETIVGAVFLAAPVFDAERAVCGSISIGVPKPRYAPALGRRIARALSTSCRRLSDVLATSAYIHEDRQLHQLR
jgi:DNA-binding IclR family transcriptional regulator